MELVTIRKAHNQSELWVLKSKLEAAGIPVFVKNEFITQVMNYMPAFVAELQVPASDVQKANEVLTLQASSEEDGEA